MPPAMFSDGQWPVMMFWYATITSVCGAFLLFNLVKSGYKYSQSALNPGVRVSFIEDIQRSVLAMGMIAMSPVVIALLIGINDGFVTLFGNLLNHFVSDASVADSNMDNEAGMFEKIISAPFRTLTNIVNWVFGLKNLDELVFNGATNIFGGFFRGFTTGNVFADVVLDTSMVGFNVYFNAIYTIRFWMITASIVVTPIVAWIWVLTAERTVLEVFFAEIIQSIFIQASHALALGIFVSIAGASGNSGNTAGSMDVSFLSNGMIQMGITVAAFAGSIGAAVLVVLGFRLITATDERSIADAKEGIKKAFIGLLILGLCLAIASFMAVLLSGNWGVDWGVTN
jgi:hypothetical protein